MDSWGSEVEKSSFSDVWSSGCTTNTSGSPRSPRSPFMSTVLQLGSQQSSSSPSSIGALSPSSPTQASPFNRTSPPSLRTLKIGSSNGTVSTAAAMTPRAPSPARAFDRNDLQPVSRDLSIDSYGNYVLSAPSFRTPPSSNAAPSGLEMAPRSTRSRPIDRTGLPSEALNFDGQVGSSASSSCRTPPGGWSSSAAPYGLDMAPRSTRSRPIDRLGIQPERLDFSGAAESSTRSQSPANELMSKGRQIAGMMVNPRDAPGCSAQSPARIAQKSPGSLQRGLQETLYYGENPNRWSIMQVQNIRPLPVISLRNQTYKYEPMSTREDSPWASALRSNRGSELRVDPRWQDPGARHEPPQGSSSSSDDIEWEQAPPPMRLPIYSSLSSPSSPGSDSSPFGSGGSWNEPSEF